MRGDYAVLHGVGHAVTHDDVGFAVAVYVRDRNLVRTGRRIHGRREKFRRDLPDRAAGRSRFAARR